MLLATAEVEVRDGRDTYQKVRALSDPGSQSHIISNLCINRLGLNRYKSNTPMIGIGKVLTQSSNRVFLEIRPVGKTDQLFATGTVTKTFIQVIRPDNNYYIKIFRFYHPDERSIISYQIVIVAFVLSM